MLDFNLRYDWLRNMMKLNKLWLGRASSGTVCNRGCTYCISFLLVKMGSKIEAEAVQQGVLAGHQIAMLVEKTPKQLIIPEELW